MDAKVLGLLPQNLLNNDVSCHTFKRNLIMENRVDILLATYQGASFLKEQLESIFTQTHSDFHLFIRDDGSTDKTLSIVSDFQKNYPGFITLIPSNKNLGIKGNFSELMRHSKANYIMFSDQDDHWLPNKIELSLKKIKEMELKYGLTTPLLVHTDLKVVKSDLSLTHPSFWAYSSLDPSLTQLNRLLVQNVVTGCTAMMNQALLKKAYPIPREVLMHDWWLALVAILFGKVEHINDSTILYRQHGKNDTGAKQYNVWEYVKKRMSKNYKNFTPQTYLQAQALFDRYQSDLNASQKEVLNAYGSLRYLPFFKRKKAIINHQFLKQGILRNIYLLTKWS
jgi:glycosyltransferase involved in cell wall biosynthesis